MKFPGDAKNLEGVYGNNEAHGKDGGGIYPVGKNECWHSGMHVFSDSGIYPLAGGELVAFRLDEAYRRVPREGRLTDEQYGCLDGDEKELYAPGGYGQCHVLKDGENRGSREVSGGFALIKHTAKLPAPEGAGGGEINFFTLYMGLLPHREFLARLSAELGTDFSGDYHALPKEMKADIPFYLKWVFRVAQGGGRPAVFREIKNFKIFRLSAFATEDAGSFFRQDPDAQMPCKFDNDPDGGLTPVRAKFADIFYDTVRLAVDGAAGSGDIPVYRYVSRTGKEKMIASLKKDARGFRPGWNADTGPEFRFPKIGWNEKDGYIKIRARGSHVQPSVVRGWLYLPKIELEPKDGMGNKPQDPGGITNAIKNAGGGKDSRGRGNPFCEWECHYADRDQIILKAENKTSDKFKPFVFDRLSGGNGIYKVIPLIAFCDYVQKKISPHILVYDGMRYLRDPATILFEHIPTDFKIINKVTIFGDRSKNLSPLTVEGKFLVVIADDKNDLFKNDPSDLLRRYAFYHGGSRRAITPYPVDAASLAGFPEDETAGAAVRAYAVSRMVELNISGKYSEGDGLEINRPWYKKLAVAGGDEPTNKAPHKSSGDEAFGPAEEEAFIRSAEPDLRPCRLFLREQESQGDAYPLLIKASDLGRLKATARGRLNLTFPGGEGGATKGFMLYDTGEKGSYKEITGGQAVDGPAGNARDIVGEGQTFELASPEGLLGDSSGRPLLLPARCGAETRFIEIPSRAGVQARLELREEYKDLGALVSPGEKISAKTLLALPGGRREKSPQIYDLACFFKDTGFMDATAPEIWGYRIPPDKTLYEERESEKRYFPPKTVFRVKAVSQTPTHKAYELEVYSMNIYCRIKKKGDNDPVEVVETKFWMADKIFKYGKDRDGNFGSVQYYRYQDKTHPEVKTNPIDSIADFVAAFSILLPSIRNKDLVRIEPSTSGIPLFRFQFCDPAGGGGSRLTMKFWVHAGALPGEPDKNTGTVSHKGGELPVYAANPLESLSPLAAAKKPQELAGTLYARNPGAKFEDAKGRRYTGFAIGGRTVYLEAAEAEACKTNMRDWGGHFRRKDTDANGDVFCERGLLRGFDGLAPPARRELVVRHPLEWDRGLYTTSHFRDIVFRGDEEGYDLLQREAAALDIWEGLKQTKEFEGARNDFRFAHPVYFVNHLERMGAFEINP
ncbi:MAG: hypothetical protein LBT33_03730, partial [Spirochaetia bacterium]|nr:hypothetical protein [Spirochaetia bacterium]